MADNWEDEADGLTTGGPPLVPLPVALNTDKWEGEDEDEVPDAWDAEPAVPAASADRKPGTAASTKPKKGKKALAETLEKKKADTGDRKKPTAAASSDSAGAAAGSGGLSAEELQKIQEESDLLIAKDTFGVNDAAPAAGLDPVKSIDLLQPSSKGDFDRLARLLTQKLRGFEASPHYPGFVEGIYRECALELDPECLRRLATMFTALAGEKLKMQKTAKVKPKKAKSTLKMERDATGAIGGEDYDDYDEFDDFM